MINHHGKVDPMQEGGIRFLAKKKILERLGKPRVSVPEKAVWESVFAEMRADLAAVEADLRMEGYL